MNKCQGPCLPHCNKSYFYYAFVLFTITIFIMFNNYDNKELEY